jgi:AcrR family transcriptional regulator
MVKKRAGLDRLTVIHAAAKLVDDPGNDALSLATLAEQLGVKKPTLYHYVNGLAGLRRELDLLASHQMAEQLGHSVMGLAGRDAIHALAGAYRSFVREHRGLYAMCIRPANEDDLELLKAHAAIVDIVRRALLAYTLDEIEAIHAIRALRSMIHGFATLEVAGGFGLPVDIDDTFRYMIDRYIDGLNRGA